MIQGHLLGELLDQQLPTDGHLHRRHVIPIHTLANHLKQLKISKEKVQRKVDNVLAKGDDATPSYSKNPVRASRLTFGSLGKHHLSLASDPLSSAATVVEAAPNLRSLRHHYIEARIPRQQLHLLVEQGGWHEDVHMEFKRELDIIESDNSLDLIRHITSNIAVLLKENGSVAEKPLMDHFQEHRILFFADFELLLMRSGMVALEDLIDLLVVSRLAKAAEIESYAQRIFSLNVNSRRIREIQRRFFLSRSINSSNCPERTGTSW